MNIRTLAHQLFGVIPTSDEDIGYPTSAQTANGGGSASTADTVLPYLDALATFRDDVRALARAKADPVEYLKLSDALRDTVLPALGVLLEDREGAKPMLKLASPEEIEGIVQCCSQWMFMCIKFTLRIY